MDMAARMSFRARRHTAFVFDLPPGDPTVKTPVEPAKNWRRFGRVAVSAAPRVRAVPDRRVSRGGRYGSAVTMVRRMKIVVAMVAAGTAVGRVVARAYAVGVSGPSMVPTLLDGDALVAYPVRRVRPGDVVIARFRSRPDLLVVKRAIRPYRDGWWIEGDNPLVTDDSRKYGEAVVLGRVLFRYWRASTVT
jgi:phage repressor protein C with HTH and peptisase S24 domain